MWNDPIIEEIHAVRRELAAECNNDLKIIVQRSMQRQERHAPLLAPRTHELPQQLKARQDHQTKGILRS